MSYTALVLGAGASMPYGFPSGERLKQDVINQGVLWAQTLGLYQSQIDNLRAFLAALSSSPLGSIDALLAANHGRFGEIGVLAMARRLLSFEADSKPYLEDHTVRMRPNDTELRTVAHHMYQTMFRELVDSTKPISSVDFRRVKIVTFNYDRSLEYYFLRGLMSTFQVDEHTAFEQLKTLEVHHVYGSLGDLAEPEPQTGRPPNLTYGEEIDRSNVELLKQACRQIRVTPSPRNYTDTFKSPREILGQAATIGYIGFSFDKTNVERLGGPAVLGELVPTYEAGRTPRSIFATCIGMTSHEASSAVELTGSYPAHSLISYVKSRGLPPNFFRITGDRLLRETGLLTNPTKRHINPGHLL